MSNRHILGILAFCLTPFAAIALPTVEEIVKGYRATIGPEKVLDGVRSLKFEGTLIPVAEGAEPMGIEITMLKPRNQLVVISRPDGSNRVGVNGYEGFTVRESADGTIREVAPLPTEEVIQLTTNAIENLNFLNYPSMVNVKGQVMGAETVRGVETIKVRFTHRNGIEYHRYFDAKTFDLVATESQGRLTVELGTFESGGLIFGDRLEVYAGDKLQHTVRFESIKVNPKVDPMTFAYPEQ